jgi:uncharacterized protein (TIGR00266 family)
VNHQVTHDPAFSLLRIDMQPGERLVSEPGAMVAMSRGVDLEAKLTVAPSPGLGATLKAGLAAVVRKFLGGESFFVTHYTTGSAGSVWLAPTMSGSIVHHRLEGRPITLSSGAYLASAGRIDVLARYGGLKGILAKEGVFFLEVHGEGDVWFNSFGGVDVIDVNGSYVVDNGHIVGWEGNLDYDLKSPGGGMVGMFASGEGLVCEFRGQGRVWIQSRNLGSIVDWLIPLLP